MEKAQDYQLKVMGKGLRIERKISQEMTRRIIGIVLGEDVSSIGKAEGFAIPNPADLDSEAIPTPKSFLAEKKPRNETERIVCLAYYLAHYRHMQQFKTRDLSDLNRDAAQPKLSNPSVTARNATMANYLALAGGGRKLVTARGEDLVKALPDRDKVKEALENHPLRKHRRRKKLTK
jgi:hypothetical protein